MKILKWKCKNCGKIIESMYKTQLENNKRNHEISCKIKRAKMKGSGKKHERT